jgi:8-oxo-dGTP pyrophosphatase MutT (NUDIX family)
MMSRQRKFLEAIASRGTVRIGVRAIVLSQGRVLVQKPVDDPDSCYAFIGGEYEVGDTLAGRLEREFEEETNARVVSSHYLFVLENRLSVGGMPIQGLEHYFQVTLDRDDIQSRERHLAQHWLPVSSLKEYDLRPLVARDAIADGRLHTVRHLVVPRASV